MGGLWLTFPFIPAQCGRGRHSTASAFPFFPQNRHQLLSWFPSGFHLLVGVLSVCLLFIFSSMCYGTEGPGPRSGLGFISVMELRIIGLVKSRLFKGTFSEGLSLALIHTHAFYRWVSPELLIRVRNWASVLGSSKIEAKSLLERTRWPLPRDSLKSLLSLDGIFHLPSFRVRRLDLFQLHPFLNLWASTWLSLRWDY